MFILSKSLNAAAANIINVNVPIAPNVNIKPNILATLNLYLNNVSTIEHAIVLTTDVITESIIIYVNFNSYSYIINNIFNNYHFKYNLCI